MMLKLKPGYKKTLVGEQSYKRIAICRPILLCAFWYAKGTPEYQEATDLPDCQDDAINDALYIAPWSAHNSEFSEVML